MKAAVIGLLGLGAGIALLLAASQRPFAASRFEFQQYRDYEGTLRARPFPMLASKNRPYWLVAPGKFGGDAMVAGLDGKQVALKGALIARGGDAMLELQPESVQVRGEGSAPTATPEQAVELTGEIVDSKCYLGVMNPGQGKVHRDCAVRCISGGIPPGLAIAGERVILITGSDGQPVNKQLLPYVGERITVRGLLGDVLKADLTTLRRVE